MHGDRLVELVSQVRVVRCEQHDGAGGAFPEHFGERFGALSVEAGGFVECEVAEVGVPSGLQENRIREK